MSTLLGTNLVAGWVSTHLKRYLSHNGSHLPPNLNVKIPKLFELPPPPGKYIPYNRPHLWSRWLFRLSRWRVEKKPGGNPEGLSTIGIPGINTESFRKLVQNPKNEQFAPENPWFGTWFISFSIWVIFRFYIFYMLVFTSVNMWSKTRSPVKASQDEIPGQ